MTAPTLTVLMAVYNGVRYLCEAIESVLEQTFTDFELLIIDDGSTDDTPAILERYAQQDPRIRIERKRNTGLAASLNAGIALAAGKYIARMDADDICLPTRMERQISFLEDNPEMVLCATRVLLFNGDRPDDPFDWEDDRLATTPQAISKMMASANCLAHPSVMFRREVFEHFAYDDQANHSQDWILWLELCAANLKLGKLSEPLLRYRCHGGSITESTNAALGLRKITQARLRFLRRSWNRNIRFTIQVIQYLLFEIASEAGRKASQILLQFLRTMGKVAARMVPARDERFLFFPHYHVGGAEVVHTEIARVAASIGPVRMFFTARSNSTAYRKAFEELGPVHDISRLCAISVTRQLLVGFLASVLERMTSPAAFGGNCRIFYYIIDETKGRIWSADIVHALGGGVENLALPRTPHINSRVVISPTVAERLKEIYSVKNLNDYASRIRIICNGVDVPEHYTEKRQETFSVIYVGRQSPEKRIHLLLRVADAVLINAPESTFTFVGFEKPEAFENGSYGGRLSFAGEVFDKNKLNSLYTEAHVMLLASEREGFPLVLQEGMAFGVVPITTDVGGIPDHIQHLSNGILVSSSNEDEIVSQMSDWIKTLRADPAVYHRLSMAAHQYTRTNFSRKSTQDAYNQLFLSKDASRSTNSIKSMQTLVKTNNHVL